MRKQDSLDTTTWPRNSLAEDHDPVVSEWISLLVHPGDVFYDLGANIGHFTVQALNAGAHVIAFEPVPSALLQIPAHKNLTLVGAAAWRRNEPVQVVMPPDSQHAEINNDRLYEHDNLLTTSLYVMGVNLDEFILLSGLPKPSIIKSDTQGCEVAWLSRMRLSTLSACRAMILEVDESCLIRHGSTSGELRWHIKRLGFRIIDEAAGNILAGKEV